jgi:nucleotide-binding universal stress UspA family protein
MYDRIAVPLDGSAPAETALAHAAEMARRFDSQILLVHVLPPGSDRGRETIEAYLKGIRDRLRGKRLAAAYSIVEMDDAARGILQCASESGASLIVMSTHGMSVHKDLLSTTIAARVLEEAHIPVLLVRPPLARVPSRS